MPEIGLLVGVLMAAVIAVYVKIMWPSPMTCGRGKTKIACIGDSITYGFGVVVKRKKYAFPALLAESDLLDCTTVNYGLSDRTLLSTADKPYFREKIGKTAWNTDADVVLFMLGSNDCKRKNWDAERFAEEYETAVRHYLSLGKKLFVMTPPNFFYEKWNPEGYSVDALRNELVPAVRSIAAKCGVGCIDLFELTKDHPEWFPDRIHPNAAGNTAIAGKIAEDIVGLI